MVTATGRTKHAFMAIITVTVGIASAAVAAMFPGSGSRNNSLLATFTVTGARGFSQPLASRW